MKLKTGIIIIGSLLWDNSIIRKSWRRYYLNQNKKIYLKLPIRYGRVSSSRMNTYTMVYSSNLSSKECGQGVVIPFKDEIDNFGKLKEIVENVIRVERDKTKEEWKCIKNGEAFTLNWNWGVVGLCINPKHINEKGKLSEKITQIAEYWKKNLSDFNPDQFSLNEDKLFINEEGIFKIEWIDELKDFDFLVSTIIKPEPKTLSKNYPSEKTIAKKMFEGNYYSYFIKNVENGIKTNIDYNVLKLIKSDYNVIKYIEQKIEKDANT